ncbi:hypothetical protein SLG_18510 [Sphingobium sp. SYK-6]|nr:hypothetical protein SLG_18510 [Sphingobium sp. SYK-6]
MLSGCLTTLFAYTTDLYPAEIRTTGLGIGETAGRLGAVGGSYVGAHVISATGSAGFFALLAAMALLLFIAYASAEYMRASLLPSKQTQSTVKLLGKS